MESFNELPSLGLEPHVKGTGLEAFSYEVFDIDDVDNSRLPADLTGSEISMTLKNINGKLIFEFKTGYALTDSTAPIELIDNNLIYFPEIDNFNIPVSIYDVRLTVIKDGFSRIFGFDKWPIFLTKKESNCCNG